MVDCNFKHCQQCLVDRVWAFLLVAIPEEIADQPGVFPAGVFVTGFCKAHNFLDHFTVRQIRVVDADKGVDHAGAFKRASSVAKINPLVRRTERVRQRRGDFFR